MITKIQSNSWKRNLSWITPAILALTTFVLRFFFQSKSLFNWDSVNFALGILDFNIVQHRPHPPGYFLYILLGRILHIWLQDINSSLVWMSMISGTLVVVIVFIFAKRRFGYAYALVSGLMATTNPLLWFYDELALTYSLEAFFSAAIGYACYRLLCGSERWALIGSILLGLAAGFRPTSLILLLPLFLFSIFKISRKVKAISISIVFLICLCWLVPMTNEVGGLNQYLAAYQDLSRLINPSPLSDALEAIVYGGGISFFIIIGYWIGLFKVVNIQWLDWERAFIIFWTVPGLLFTTLRHFGQSGYILFLLPVILIYSPPMLCDALKAYRSRFSEKKQAPISLMFSMLVGTILITNSILFLLGGNYTINIQDQRWGRVEKIKEIYPPGGTIILTDFNAISGFRHISYYFPEYHTYGLIAASIFSPIYIKKYRDTILGWSFHSQYRRDDFDLRPNVHPVHTLLVLPPGTTGLLITGDTVIDAFQFQIDRNELEKFRLRKISDWITYISLPQGAKELVFQNSYIEIR